MGFEFKSQVGYVLLRLYGKMEVRDLYEIAKHLDAAEQPGRPSPHRFIDMTEVEEVSLNFDNMHGFTSGRSGVKLKNMVRVAVVTKNIVQFGLARMFQTLNQQPQTEVSVFHDQETARRWLLDEAVSVI